MSWKFNPNLKEFIDTNPKMSLLGFTWATYWRMVVIVLAVEVILLVVFGLIVWLFTAF